MQNDLTSYLRAGYPGLCNVTPEEARAEAGIAAVCTGLGRKLAAWSSTDGLVELPEGRTGPCPDPLDAMVLANRLFENEEPQHVVLMRDLQLHLDQQDPLLVRRLRDTLRLAKAKGHALILLGCRLKLPAELEHEFATVDFALPGTARLGEVLDGVLGSADLQAPAAEVREAALRNALGLTTVEAENVFALSLVETGAVEPALVAAEKARTFKRNGLIEVVESHEGLTDIGGLGILKDWLRNRALSFGEAARAYGLPTPKGLLIVGIPGTGKSLTAKATANDVTQLPPEFLRKGRFGEMFFVDLPDSTERAAIWDIVIAKYGRQPTHYDSVVLARACELFTGAEIEAVFCDALYQAFAAGREPKPADMLEAINRTVPLAQLMDNQIAALRQWARGRARVAGVDRTGGRCNGRRVQA